MADRLPRLLRLKALQETVTRLHETKFATLLADAARARAEAEEMARAKDAPDSLAPLFPDLYDRSIASALDRGERLAVAAAAEADTVRKERRRAERVDASVTRERDMNERQNDERDAVERVGAGSLRSE